MKIHHYIFLSVACFLAQNCSSDCSQPTPEYCQLIKYDPNFYEPVCGCDGKTYTNVAVAECEFGILDHFPGECN